MRAGRRIGYFPKAQQDRKLRSPSPTLKAWSAARRSSMLGRQGVGWGDGGRGRGVRVTWRRDGKRGLDRARAEKDGNGGGAHPSLRQRHHKLQVHSTGCQTRRWRTHASSPGPWACRKQLRYSPLSRSYLRAPASTTQL